MESPVNLQNAFLKLIDSIGEYSIEQKKDSIHITRGRAFAGIHPKKSYLGVNLVLNRSQTDLLADKVEKVSANRYHHFFKITSEHQFNREFIKLVKEAYKLAEPKK